jgi:hypothetical protein
MIKHTIAMLLAIGAFVLAPGVAHAGATDEHDPHGSAALLVGYGFKDYSNFGIGARGGYTLAQNIYIGGLLQYHFGKSEGPATGNIYYFGVEGGYDFHVDPVIIRPYLGLGPAFGHASVDQVCVGTFCTDGGSNTETRFGIWLGGTVLYPINDTWFVGGDFRLPIIDGDVYATLSATGGLNF